MASTVDLRRRLSLLAVRGVHVFGLAIRAVRTLPDVARGLGARQLLLRAAALTYLSIVSLVPLLAVILYGLEAFRLFDFEELVRTFVFDNLAVGVREQVADQLGKLVANAGSTAEGGLGLLFLLLTSLLLLRNIEKSFDELWGIQETRPIARQIPRHLGLLFAGPLVLGLSLAATATLRTWALVSGISLGLLVGLLPLLLSAAGFTLLYLVAPAARVRPRAALVAGVLAASVWELAKLAYAAYAAHSLRTDSIYGPLAALPLFLVWIYVSWMIVLFGGRVAYAIQHPEGLRLARDEQAAARALELCAARVAVACAVIQRTGAPEPTLHELARSLRFPEGIVRAVVQELERAALVRTRGRHVALLRPASEVSLGTVLQAVRRPISERDRHRDPLSLALSGLLRSADDEGSRALERHDLASLAAPVEGGQGLPLAKA